MFSRLQKVIFPDQAQQSVFRNHVRYIVYTVQQVCTVAGQRAFSPSLISCGQTISALSSEPPFANNSLLRSASEDASTVSNTVYYVLLCSPPPPSSYQQGRSDGQCCRSPKGALPSPPFSTLLPPPSIQACVRASFAIFRQRTLPSSLLAVSLHTKQGHSLKGRPESIGRE